MRDISAEGLELIKRFEGFSATPYICPAGRLTVGYGHVVQDNEQFLRPITRTEANHVLQCDMVMYVRQINHLILINISQCQFDALASFGYNVGVKAFEKSSLLRFLNEGECAAAAAEFPKWVWANGKKMPGLARRRAAERDFFEKGETFTKL